MKEEKNMPDTSLESFRALTPEKLSKDYGDIILALKFLNEATYEEIVNHLKWTDLSKCSRRMKELQSMQLIYKPGTKRLTSRNRFAYTYKLVGNTVTDYSRKLIQKELF